MIESQCGKYARELTITECERLFGLADGATAMPGASNTLRRTLLGSGFIPDMVAFLIAQSPL